MITYYQTVPIPGGRYAVIERKGSTDFRWTRTFPDRESASIAIGHEEKRKRYGPYHG